MMSQTSSRTCSQLFSLVKGDDTAKLERELKALCSSCSSAAAAATSGAAAAAAAAAAAEDLSSWLDSSDRNLLHHVRSAEAVRVITECAGEELLQQLLTTHDKYGAAPIHSVVRGGYAEAACKLLRMSPACVSLLDARGDSILHLCRKEHLAHLLCDAGASPSIRNRNGRMPVHAAAVRGDTGVLSVLLQRMKQPKDALQSESGSGKVSLDDHAPAPDSSVEESKQSKTFTLSLRATKLPQFDFMSKPNALVALNASPGGRLLGQTEVVPASTDPEWKTPVEFQWNPERDSDQLIKAVIYDDAMDGSQIQAGDSIAMVKISTVELVDARKETVWKLGHKKKQKGRLVRSAGSELCITCVCVDSVNSEQHLDSGVNTAITAGPDASLEELTIPSDDFSINPLHLAAEAGHLQIVEQLLAMFPACVNDTTLAGWTALHFACLGAWPQRESHVRIADTLIKAGANVKLCDISGFTPLHVCTDAPAARLLLEAGADPDARDIDGRAPLHTCAPESVFLLLESGAPMAPVDYYGRTPLHLATSPDKVIILAAKGANVNLSDGKGWSPLDWAQTTQRWEVAEALVNSGGVARRKLAKDEEERKQAKEEPTEASSTAWCSIM